MRGSVPDQTTPQPTLAALAALPSLAADLAVELLQPTARTTAGTRGKPTSRPPIDLGIVDDTELSWNVVTTWARDWMECDDLAGPKHWTWIAVCEWLAAHYPRMQTIHPAINEFDDEIAQCQHRMRKHLATGEHRSWEHLPGRWNCPTQECGALLRQHMTLRYIYCPGCGTTWEEPQYELLGRILGESLEVTVAQAAAFAKVSKSTIWRWIGSGLLPKDDAGRVDRRDLVALLMRKERAN